MFCSVTAQTQQKTHIPAPHQLSRPSPRFVQWQILHRDPAPGTFPQPVPASAWHGEHTQVRRSGGAGPNAARRLGPARLPLVGQEFESKGRFSNRHLLAEWWWLGSNRHFSAETNTAKRGAKCQSFLYLWIHNVRNKTLTCNIWLLEKMKRGYFQIPQMTWVLQLEVKELQSLPKMLQ